MILKCLLQNDDNIYTVVNMKMKNSSSFLLLLPVYLYMVTFVSKTATI